MTVPTAFAAYPDPRSPMPPRSWVERGYAVTRWTEPPRGGHFAAMEAPDLFVRDLRAWAATCRRIDRSDAASRGHRHRPAAPFPADRVRGTRVARACLPDTGSAPMKAVVWHRIGDIRLDEVPFGWNDGDATDVDLEDDHG